MRRILVRIQGAPGYATLDATQKTSRKTSKNGQLFISDSLIPTFIVPSMTRNGKKIWIFEYHIRQ
ncbi:MAG: hypothetical protein BA865_02120 [Desulfobacterales bacterium S5133MH4]|nr:MAG: hypothetical protein BA865_02120 [Desulfobacterales bacterium S5133MH4]